MKIKVLLLVQDLNIGGMERVVEKISSELDKEKYNVQVWSIVSGGDVVQEIRDAGVKVEVLNIRTYFNPFNILKLAYLIKKFKPDIVHTHGYFPSVIGRIAAKVAGVPVIINHLHTLFYLPHLRNIIIDKFLNLFTDVIICVSGKVKESFINAGYKIKTKAVIVFNRVDEAVFKPVFWNNEIKNLICVGSLCSNKRQIDILKAFKIVLTTYPELNLQIVGDGPLRENLQETSRKLGIFSNVQFLGLRKDIPSLLSGAQIFIHASGREGFSFAVVEAMACALPVIVSTGISNEIVQNGENGLIYPIGDYQSLSVAIETLLKNPRQAGQMGLRGRKIVETKFAYEVMAHRINELYTTLLNKKCIKKRISFLDGLRGLAILMVILFHAYARWPEFVPYGNKYSEIMFFKYGYLGVDLFFMISGFVILMTLEKTANFFQFMYHRWLRLFPAMLIVSILVFTTARTVFPERPDGIPVLRDLLSGLTFIDNNALGRIFHSPQGLLEGSFWSLFIEVKFYVVFGIIFFALGTDMAIAGLIGLFVWYVLKNPFVDPFSTSYSMGWFASGAMYYLYFKSGRKKWLWMGMLMALVSAAFLHRDVDAKLAAAMMSLFFMAVMMSERLQSIISSRFLLFLGFVSYPLYLIHDNMMISLIVKSGRWVPLMPNFLLPIIPIVIVIAISWIVARYAEPGLRNMLRGIFEGRKTEEAKNA